MSFTPATAPTGRPPARILASTGSSGTMPYRAGAPLRDQRELRGLGPGAGEAHAPGRRHEPLHELGPAHLELVRGAPVRAERRLALHRLDERRMRMAEEQRAVAAEVVDVLVAVDVPLARAGSARDVDRIGGSRTRIVREARRQHAAGLRIEGGGTRRAGAVLVFDHAVYYVSPGGERQC